MDDTKYLYEVRPRKPVRIPGTRATMMRRSVPLTKEEVKEYMKCGPVYRKSVKGEMILVTGENLDKLHIPFDQEPNNQPKAEPEPVQQLVTNHGNNQKQWNSGKNKNRHNNGGSNYHGDDRGKATMNGGIPAPQYNGDQSEPEQTSPTMPVVNLP